jgi:NADPH:quinone reductase-like Zn-dependent oxidoreductase
MKRPFFFAINMFKNHWLIIAVFVPSVFAPVARGEAVTPATQPSMKAVRAHEQQLAYDDAPRPSPDPGEMLLKVYAAGVNPVDWKMLGRSRRGQNADQAWIPGFDISGVVESVGSGVTKFKPGDEVFAFLALGRGGGYAEFAIVHETEAARKPQNIAHVAAASVPLVALTAWQALFDAGKLEAGQTVLIQGGAGGVGTMAVQLAKWKKARVIATASGKNVQFLRELGADDVIDYQTQKFEDVAKDIDLVLDTVGGETQTRSWNVLKKGGTLVSIVGPPSQELAKQHEARGVGILVKANADELEQIVKLLESGSLKPIVTEVFPLSEAAKAIEQSQTHHTRGKIVLRVVQGAGDATTSPPP